MSFKKVNFKMASFLRLLTIQRIAASIEYYQLVLKCKLGILLSGLKMQIWNITVVLKANLEYYKLVLKCNLEYY